jgi:LCP family protein required for cell wall assembly
MSDATGPAAEAAADPQSIPESTPPTGRRAAARPGRPNRRRRAIRKVRILKYTAVTAGVAVLAAVGGGYLYIQDLNSNIRSDPLHADPGVHVPVPKANAAGQMPLNILMIGSDTRDTTADCDLGGSCDSSLPHADVEMLVHLSADRSNISVLSIPRDTTVQIANCAGHQGTTAIITDSLNYGPGCTVDTWEKLTGIDINAYMMIDFSGVVKMTDAVGGVQVCTKQNVADYQVSYDQNGVRHETGSHLELAAGTHTIKGEQALEWLRTRHAFVDGSDIGRTEAQHLYLNSLIRKFQNAGTLSDPFTLNSLAQAATSSLVVSPSLKSISALSSLALKLIKVPADRITMLTMPFVYGANPSDPQALPVLPNAASYQVFQMIANDIPLSSYKATTAAAGPSPSATASASAVAVDKAEVKVSVENSTSVDGRGGQLTQVLQGKGFTEAVRNTRYVAPQTTRLSYPTADKAQAQAVATALGLTPAQLTASASADQLVLVIGTDWTSGDNYAATLPKAGALPSAASALAQNAGTDSSQCMSVNPSPYRSFAPGQTGYEYSWTGATPPVVPQP